MYEMVLLSSIISNKTSLMLLAFTHAFQDGGN